MNTGSAPRYVLRFFFDPPTHTCFWAGNQETEADFDYPIDAEDLPISVPTVREVQRLVASHEAFADPLDPAQLRWTQEEFSNLRSEVDRVLAAVEKELGPDFKIAREWLW